MATTDTKEETESKPEKKDEVTGDSYVWDAKQQKYVQKSLSPELYRQQKAAQRRQATTAGIAGLGAEALQFGIGATIFGDPAIRAAGQEKARIEAELSKGPDFLTESEKSARRQAALAPVERRAEALQRRAEAVAASTGDVSVRSMLAAGEAGIGQIAQQALQAEAEIAREDVRRIEAKDVKDEKLRRDRDSIDAMMLELRNKYIREPLHKFIGDAGKLAGTLMAYAPAKSIDQQVADLKAAGANNKEISDFVKFAKRRGPKKVDKEFNRILGTLPRPVEGDPDREMSGRNQAIDKADAALEASGRKARTDATGVTDAEPEEGMDVSVEEIKARVEADQTETEVKKRAREAAADLQRTRQARLAPYSKAQFNPFNRSTGGDFAWQKGNETYVFDPNKEMWLAYKGGRKLDFEVTLDEAETSDDPNVRELYDLAVREGLLDERDLRESMR